MVYLVIVGEQTKIAYHMHHIDRGGLNNPGCSMQFFYRIF